MVVVLVVLLQSGYQFLGYLVIKHRLRYNQFSLSKTVKHLSGHSSVLLPSRY